MPITEAHRIRCKRYRERHPDRVRDSKRKWNQKNLDKVRKHSKENYRRNKQKRLLHNRLYAKQHPEILRCHWKAARTTVLMAKTCELCPEDDIRTDNLQKHHPDHQFPDVFVTACPSCHKFAEEILQVEQG